MSENSLILNIEIGIIKDLFKSGLITETQRERAIQILKDKFVKELRSKMDGNE